ncbi:CopG family transcriptional regulator [uncultured Ruminococcus sp.]|uniref:ribbon-helix-helix domain-containing protein n=1 Tax=uncultured Ruminococcus sp. TaxID=165186 RepID=UPI002628418D|nr:CopG family transcriptional regulator [uncultured Ruminococcus sp.]
MKRSTYSLILMDDVVAAIDRLAVQQGTSRSNLINQILAEHVSCTTPEQQMRQVFSCMMQQMDPAFRIQEQGSDAMLSVFGSVQYKYRPTIRYSVELLRDLRREEIGQLKISCRTQSRTLLDAMQTFFQFWVRLEQAYDPKGACAQGLYEIAPGRMTRVLLRHGIRADDALGMAVGEYIRMFHAVLQSYFTGLQQELPGAVLQHTLEQQYLAIRQKQAYQL